jgi:hypothetical protein
LAIHVPTNPANHLVFDLAAWGCGLALGALLYRWRLKGTTERLRAALGSGYFIALAAGAVLGGWWTGSLNTLREQHPALSHSVLGALAGAIVAVEAFKAVKGIRGSTGGVFVGPFAIGLVIGRWGCLFSGLTDRTYGRPTGLPWAVDLGDGIGRHPVQIYESAAMALFLAIYLFALARRDDWALRRAFYALCVWYGLQRFVWEFLKPYPTVLGPFNLFQVICGGMVIYGVLGWRTGARGAQKRPLPVPGPDHQPLRDLP